MTSQPAAQVPRHLARPRSERKRPEALAQHSLFESEQLAVPSASVSLEEVQPSLVVKDAPVGPLLQEQEETQAVQPGQEGSQVSAPLPDPPLWTEPGMLAWPFAHPPESLARAIERCVDCLSQSSISGSRDAGFWQLIYLLCAKQAEERHAEWPKRFYADQKEVKKEHSAQAIQERILPLFEQVKTACPGLFAEDETLRLSANTLAPLILALCNQDLLASELDPFGAAYQQWAGARAREWRAQFFTPLGVAYFMVSLLQPQAQERVLDASCGAGVFFRALHIYRWYYLAGMAPLLEEVGYALPEEELQQQLTTYMRSHVYGADLDGTLIRLARLQIALLDGDPAHVYHMDSFAFPDADGDQEAKTQIPLESFDLIVGNPPYSLPVTDPTVLSKYELARVWKRQGEAGFLRTDQLQKKVPTEVLFMEQALNWLKPGGRMALVVPESLLSNPGTAYVRYWLMRHAFIVASISLPGETFQAQSHTSVHTGVLVLRKMTQADLEEEKAPHNYSVYMAVVDAVGYDSRGRTVYTRTPDGELQQHAGKRQVNNELPTVLANFWRFQASRKVDPLPPRLKDPLEPAADGDKRIMGFSEELEYSAPTSSWKPITYPGTKPTNDEVMRGEVITNDKDGQDKPARKRRLRKDQPDPEWTYTPPPLSEQAERFLALWVKQHPLTSERGLMVFMHVPILRQILSWLEQPEGGPTEEQRQRAGGHETNVHIASHADLLMFRAGTRAEREQVFIEVIEGFALLAFASGGIPRLPELCEAHDAEVLARAFTAFKEAEQNAGGLTDGRMV